MKPLMELLRSFYIQRLILYCIIAFFSFFVVVPMGDLKIRFTDDHCSKCILYSNLIHNNISQADAAADNLSVSCAFHVEFGDQEVCEYNIAVSSVFCLIYPLVVGAIYFHMYRRDSQETRDENKIDLANCLFLLHILVEVIVTFLVMVSAGMISHGFSHICTSLQSSTFGGSCLSAQDCNSWGYYDGSNFYISLAVATAGSWFLFVSWLLQALLGLWKLWRLNMLPHFSALCKCLPCCRNEE